MVKSSGEIEVFKKLGNVCLFVCLFVFLLKSFSDLCIVNIQEGDMI